MTSRKPEDAVEEIPEKLYDASAKTTYKRLRFFGKVRNLKGFSSLTSTGSFEMITETLLHLLLLPSRAALQSVTRL